jgi:acetolactate synthase-1/2/3 large subunit
VDFAAVARGFGLWAARVATMSELDEAVRAALASVKPALIDVAIDPAEYRAHIAPPRRR